MAKAKDQWRRLLEVTVALEIAKTERDAYRGRLDEMREQLSAATTRAERAEERLAETTRMLFDLSRDAVAVRPQSSATEVMVEGLLDSTCQWLGAVTVNWKLALRSGCSNTA